MFTPPMPDQFLFKQRGAVVGMPGIFKPSPSCQHADPGRRDKPHLGSQLPGLFAAILELIGQFTIKENNRFSQRHAVFCASQAEHIDSGSPGDIGRSNVERYYRVGKTSPVHLDQ